jgi:hypothetical protein
MKFFVNSTGTGAYRLTEIDFVSIHEDAVSHIFSVIARMGRCDMQVVETATTLQDAQAKALPLLQALEA